MQEQQMKNIWKKWSFLNLFIQSILFCFGGTFPLPLQF